MAASARGPHVLDQMLREDPQRGTDSLYQKMADAQYERQERFTFLTLAGIVAVFAAGDSWWLILVGMSIVTAILMGAESLTRRITGNEIACGVVAVTGAFVTSQVTYPKLFGVFLIELWGTLAALAVVMWLLDRAGGGRSVSSR
jgi:hypothetical protein